MAASKPGPPRAGTTGRPRPVGRVGRPRTGRTGFPPERIELPGLILRRVVPGDAEMLAATLTADLDRLAEWLAWAVPAAATVEAQVRRLPRTVARWREGISFQYVLLDPATGAHLGNAGLERTVGPRALEMGYWLTQEATGRGHATAAARALTEAGLSLAGVERVEIHCDEANHRSRLVPQRLGYRLHRTQDDPHPAPAASGRSLVWVYPP